MNDAATDAREPVSTPSPEEVLPLAPDDAGAEIRDLQHRLMRAGVLGALPETDAYCEATTAAVRAFQSQRRLRADGICNHATWNALVESDQRLGDRLR